MLSVVINMKRTGENIHVLRRRAGFSVRELSEIMGFSTSHTIYRWQKGETLPSIDSLVVLSELFGVTINEIIAIDIDPPNVNVETRHVVFRTYTE